MPFEHQVTEYWGWLLGNPGAVRLLDSRSWSQIGFLLGAGGILLLLAVIVHVAIARDNRRTARHVHRCDDLLLKIRNGGR